MNLKKNCCTLCEYFYIIYYGSLRNSKMDNILIVLVVLCVELGQYVAMRIMENAPIVLHMKRLGFSLGYFGESISRQCGTDCGTS